MTLRVLGGGYRQPMPARSLYGMVDFIKDQAKRMLQEDGFHSPMLFLHEGEWLGILSIELPNHQAKEVLCQFIMDRIRNQGLKELIFATEAWMAEAKCGSEEEKRLKEMLDQGESVENIEGCKEVLQILYASADVEVAHLASIFRDGQDCLSVGPWQDPVYTNSSDTKGRLCNLFRRAKLGV